MVREVADRLSVHVIRRGNNRGHIFGDDYDREMFLAQLEAASIHHAVDVNAFALMSNHYHAIMTAPDNGCLSLLLRDLGREYVCRYNKRHDRIGTLWAGKPRRLTIWHERYWLACLRYIEQNPIRANIVKEPAEYRWSSYAFHALGARSSLLVHHPVYLALGSTDLERQKAYRSLFAQNLTASDLVRQRMAWPATNPTGSQEAPQATSM